MKTLFIIAMSFLSLNFCEKEKHSQCDPFLEKNNLIDTIEVNVELLDMVQLPSIPALFYL
ncbi:hypothetical protein I5M32_13320 [Pedobacter sp. SD-b]|uniref:Uncharacterized protein n=1 Tax=Pedobacter segetis TaxID=2793069 RepID=A0ABS1BM20_9SPHI|nr:hypothetical protein [Pedobacter segetis]MBK0383943.1 hypothetical protein [Pedobacter segetis]